MQRIIFFVVVLLVVWRILATIGRRLAERAPGADSFSRFSPQSRRRRRQSSDGSAGHVEELVECTYCGTFVPAVRSLTSGENRAAYCSEECRQQAAGTTPDVGG